MNSFVDVTVCPEDVRESKCIQEGVITFLFFFGGGGWGGWRGELYVLLYMTTVNFFRLKPGNLQPPYKRHGDSMFESMGKL